jgi:hypothetical protein
MAADRILASPEDIRAAGDIIAWAEEEQRRVAQEINGQSDIFGGAHWGSGRIVGQENFMNLGAAGEALSRALNDVFLSLTGTAMVADETNAQAHSELRNVVPPEAIVSGMSA